MPRSHAHRRLSMEDAVDHGANGVPSAAAAVIATSYGDEDDDARYAMSAAQVDELEAQVQQDDKATANRTGPSANAAVASRMVEKPAGMSATVVVPLLSDAAQDVKFISYLHSLRDYSDHVDKTTWRYQIGAILESRVAMICILIMLFVDITIVLLQILSGAFGFLESPAEREAMDAISYIILILFIAELLALMASYGKRFFSHKGYVCDIIVVPTSLVLEIEYGDAAGLLVMLRLWRLARVLHELFGKAKQHRYEKTLSHVLDGLDSEVDDRIGDYDAASVSTGAAPSSSSSTSLKRGKGGKKSKYATVHAADTMEMAEFDNGGDVGALEEEDDDEEVEM